MRKIRAAIAAIGALLLVVVVATAGAGADGVRPSVGHWYGESAGGGWIAFRVAIRDRRRIVTDVTASSRHPGCTIRVDPRGRPRLRSLRVDSRGRFADSARDELVAGGRFTHPRRVRGTIRWTAAAADRRGCSAPMPELRFTAAPAALRLPAGRWSGTLAEQTAPDGSRVAAQPLGFDVLRGGRLMRTGALRLSFLVGCPPAGPLPAPGAVPVTSRAVFESARPFGAVGGRRAIPPRRSFTLVDEPLSEGVALRWQITVDGDRATGSVFAQRIGPASSCGSERIAWSARRG